jgi:hypothetical protein
MIEIAKGERKGSPFFMIWPEPKNCLSCKEIIRLSDKIFITLGNYQSFDFFLLLLGEISCKNK